MLSRLTKALAIHLAFLFLVIPSFLQENKVVITTKSIYNVLYKLEIHHFFFHFQTHPNCHHIRLSNDQKQRMWQHSTSKTTCNTNAYFVTRSPCKSQTLIAKLTPPRNENSQTWSTAIKCYCPKLIHTYIHIQLSSDHLHHDTS